MKPDMSSELRAMVREVLRDVMGNRSAAGCETVRLTNDQDLASFVSRIIEPATLEKIKAGTLRFTLGDAKPQAIASPSTLTGVITEQKIGKLGASATLILGPDAVLTPLARDKARKLGLKIERRR